MRHRIYCTSGYYQYHRELFLQEVNRVIQDVAEQNRYSSVDELIDAVLQNVSFLIADGEFADLGIDVPSDYTEWLPEYVSEYVDDFV